MLLQAYELRNAGAVLHSHSINAVLATLLQEGNKGEGCVGEFRVTNLEMIKVRPCHAAGSHIDKLLHHIGFLGSIDQGKDSK